MTTRYPGITQQDWLNREQYTKPQFEEPLTLMDTYAPGTHTPNFVKRARHNLQTLKLSASHWRFIIHGQNQD